MGDAPRGELRPPGLRQVGDLQRTLLGDRGQCHTRDQLMCKVREGSLKNIPNGHVLSAERERKPTPGPHPLSAKRVFFLQKKGKMRRMPRNASIYVCYSFIIIFGKFASFHFVRYFSWIFTYEYILFCGHCVHLNIKKYIFFFYL